MLTRINVDNLRVIRMDYIGKRLDKRSDQTQLKRRASLKKIALASAGAAIWHKPLVDAVVLPAHAQTSTMVTNIIAESLDADNPFARFILIVDSNDAVLANCGASGGTAAADNLAAGVYRVVADSNGARNQQVTVTAGPNSQTITVPTDTGTCNFLVATIELPAGRIVPANGEQVTGPWSCSTNQNTGCQ